MFFRTILIEVDYLYVVLLISMESSLMIRIWIQMLL
nr:MAG TPA: hypothetical protein [Bacteriophage sp.]